jgi:PAS domain S-box-containing protein
MFESFLAVPFHFTIEFVGFLVAAGAALLIPSRPSLVPGPPVGRFAAAAGFAALAVAQVAHGASFVPHDGDPNWVLIRAGGYALVLFGILGTRQAPATAAAILPVREPLLAAPAGAALVLFVAAAASSFRHGLVPYRRLAIAALFFAVSEAMTSVVPHATFGSGVAEPVAYGAHGVRLAGYLALSWWLWAGVRVSIRTRFVAAFTVLLMVVVLALAATLTGVISTNVEREELERLTSQLNNAVRNMTQTEAAQLKDRIAVLRELSATVQRPILTRRGLDVLTAQLVQGELLGENDFALVTDPSGNLLKDAAAGIEPASTQRDANDPVPLSDRKLQRILGSPVLTELVDDRFDIAVSVDRIDSSSVALLAAAPVEAPNTSRTAGILVIGSWIDFLTIDELSALVKPARATLIALDEVAATRLPPADARDLDLAGARDELLVGETVASREILGDRAYFTAYAPLTNAAGDHVATLALSSPDRVIIQTRLDVTRNLFVIALLIGVVALVLAWFSGRRITKPIQSLTMRAREVREGDLTVKAEVTGDDEVGQLGETFNEMTASLQTMTGDLRAAVREEGRLRSRIETIIQSMADGLVAVDAGGNVLAFNIEAELLTGIKAEDAIGRPIDDVVEVQNHQGARTRLPISDLAEGSVGGVYLVRRFGSPLPVAVTCAVLKGEEDEAAGGVAVIRDVSREYEVEKMKSEFLSNISHELRTPLTPIKGYAEILDRKDVPPEKARHFVKGILESTSRLERIVELLVDFAAMEAGRLAPKATPVDVAALLSAIAESWDRRSPRHDIVAKVKARVPRAAGDERLLRRSIEEIVDNAVKFSPEGGEITLCAGAVTDGDGRKVCVEIADRGIGISPEEVPKIFSDFHQLDGSETRTYGGLGLGLTFVRRIVEAHGGHIGVESEPGAGSVFRITLPVARRARADGSARRGEGGAATG